LHTEQLTVGMLHLRHFTPDPDEPPPKKPPPVTGAQSFP
jgi:hypothetical protein